MDRVSPLTELKEPMTRYSELYRAERAEIERLKAEFERHFGATLGDLNLLRDFIRENDLQDQLAQWALKRTTT
jgi:hypothetical protein